MAASDPTDAVQKGLYDLLNGDGTLTTLAPIYDGIPEGIDAPWVVLGEVTTTQDNVHGNEGRAIDATIHSWAKANGMKPVNDIGARIVALLDHQHTALDTLVTGHTVWRVAHEFTQTLDDPEPHYRHRVDRFRILTSQG